MTLRIASLLLLAIVLGLVGCRDSLVDEPPPPGNQTPPPDSSEVNTIYLKGGSELQVGMTQSYRAESVSEAVRYRWSLAGGTGAVTGTSSDPRLRLYDITGVTPGTVEVFVSAHGEDDEVLGVARKAIRVYP